VDQTTEAIDAFDWPSGVHWLEGDRRVEVESSMWSGAVAMGDELVEHPLEMMSPEDEHPVRAFSAGGPDESLRVRVGPG